MQQMTDAQVHEWLDFTAEEPLGDERDDLRIGALASVIMNMHMDTKHGEITPLGYLSMLTRDRTYAMTLDPKLQAGDGEGTGGSGSGIDALDKIGTDADDTLNNPIVWENTMAKLVKYMGGIRKQSTQ